MLDAVYGSEEFISSYFDNNEVLQLSKEAIEKMVKESECVELTVYELGRFIVS